MKLIVTFKSPFDVPVGSAQNNSVTIENISNIAYNSSNDTMTITYGNNITVSYIYSKYLFMFVN